MRRRARPLTDCYSNALKTLVQNSTRPGESLPGVVTFGIGGAAGLITVLVTMPVECVFSIWRDSTYSTVKTRMQSLSGRTEYVRATVSSRRLTHAQSSTLNCFYRIATEEGILRFWKGTTPRLGRLVVRRAQIGQR